MLVSSSRVAVMAGWLGACARRCAGAGPFCELRAARASPCVTSGAS
jgi:hypothetical protein